MDSADRFEVTGTNGVRLSVRCQGDPAARPVLLVHGYPDTLGVWDVVAAQLCPGHHVIRYDSRGAGASGVPPQRLDYRLAALAGDAQRVAAAVRPGERVHLVGHDWGSVTGWEAVCEPAAPDWIASFTAVSGPHPAHAAAWAGGLLRNPGAESLQLLARQQIRSWYLFAFQLPILPELTWRHFLGPRWANRLRRTEGTNTSAGHPASTLTEDAVHGLGMYRANLFARPASLTSRRSTVPVQLVVPLKDRYITANLADSSLRWVDRAWRRTLDTGHWGALLTHGSTLGSWITDFAEHIDGAPAKPDLAAAAVGGR